MRLFMILFASAALAWGQASQPLRLEKTIELPEVQGRIDHLSVDVKGQRLFVTLRCFVSNRKNKDRSQASLFMTS
jgi:hypothetical protein